MKPQPPSDLWDKMDRLNKTNGYYENDPGFSIVEYAERYGIPPNIARCRLNRWVEKGHLTKGRSTRNGKTCVVYRFPDEERNSTLAAACKS